MQKTAALGSIPVSFSGRRLASIDCFRFLAFLCVVAIHTATDPITRVLSEVGRFAVPFFFTASGFFLISDAENWRLPAQRVVRRVMPIFVFWLLVYVGI